MRNFLAAGLIAFSSGHAFASEQRFLVTFKPDDNTRPFTMCFIEQDEGAFPPFQDGGSLLGFKGPYSGVEGGYSIDNNQLMLVVGSSSGDDVTDIVMTGETKNGRFRKVYNPRFTIYTVPDRQMPVSDVTEPPVASSIVTTGSFTTANSCRE